MLTIPITASQLRDIHFCIEDTICNARIGRKGLQNCLIRERKNPHIMTETGAIAPSQFAEYDRIEKLATDLKASLPNYYRVWHMIRKDGAEFWIAAQDATEAFAFFPENQYNNVIEISPTDILTVHDTSGMIGPLERTAEDWANTHGKAYLIALTVEKIADDSNPPPAMELPTLVLSETGQVAAEVDPSTSVLEAVASKIDQSTVSAENAPENDQSAPATESQTLRVYRLNDKVWWLAYSVEEAINLYSNVDKLGRSLINIKAVDIDDPREITEDELKQVDFTVYDQEGQASIAYRFTTAYKLAIEKDPKTPRFFANFYNPKFPWIPDVLTEEL